MNKHTPGPWKVTGEELVSVGDQELFHRVIRDEGERWTALVEIEDREGEANAHLIAAAPAMYALLKRAAISLQEYCAEINGDMNDSLACEIEATIAQAEGVSHE